jgi:hypothetical protein
MTPSRTVRRPPLPRPGGCLADRHDLEPLRQTVLSSTAPPAAQARFGHRAGLTVLLLPLIIVLAGCADRVAKTLLVQHDDDTFASPLHGRYVLVHAVGYGLNRDFGAMSELQARTWRRRILERLDHAVASLRDRKDCGPGASGHPQLRVLVFVHGGLNSYDDGARKMAAYLTTTPPPPYTEPPNGPADILRIACVSPIFISWNSEPFSLDRRFMEWL